MSQSPVLLDQKLLFGRAAKPVTCGHGIVLGNGVVYPEINFTLPSLDLEKVGRERVRREYEEMITGVCQRAVELESPGLVVELELLPPMTLDPQWGADITALIRETLDGYHDKRGLKSALRVTPVDTRDIERPIRMRTGRMTQVMLQSFDLCARAGADLLSIESTGGKEVHDETLLRADLNGIVYALGVLACRDMNFLWSHIVRISKETGRLPAGDTACGLANTAMVLADKGMIPRVLAAVVRVASAVRSLQAYRQGAVGPSKDCAYEGPYIKAMTGVPISMEGRSSACAHLSHVGNIAGACCDLWSNESVQNVRLLSANAPIVSMEQLVYDCRLMNLALEDGEPEALRLQRLFVESDAHRDPQAWVLRPDVVVRICEAIAPIADPLAMTLVAIDTALAEMRDAWQAGRLRLAPTEQKWLDLLSFQRDALPESEDELCATVQSALEVEHFPDEYGM